MQLLTSLHDCVTLVKQLVSERTCSLICWQLMDHWWPFFDFRAMHVMEFDIG